MKKIRHFSIVFPVLVASLLTFLPAMAQSLPKDSVQVLALQEFYQLLLQHHPVASQANLLTEQARQELRIARGTLDPVLSSKFSRKEFG
ncbi:MAG: hypothetical protein ACO1NZ_18650, partial [Adhaeribacter sp.]